MSFLKPLLGSAGGALMNNPNLGLGLVGLLGLGGKGGGGGGGETAAAAPVAPADPQANAAAMGLGKLIGVDPGKISSIADSVGKGMNMIAQGGGAPASYQTPELPAVNNHLQLLDNNTLQALLRQFLGGNR